MITTFPQHRHCGVILCIALICVACGQKSQAQGPATYSKTKGWSSVCLGKTSLDLPDEVDVAESNTNHFSGYGFDPGIMGAATPRQQWNRIKVQETNVTTQRSLKDIRDFAAFQNAQKKRSAEERYPREVKLAGEAKLPDAYAYGFVYFGSFDIGYFEPFDKRIRLFEGGLPGEGDLNTKQDVQAKYKELRSLYTARRPQTLPTEPGVCTPFGFFKDPPSGPVTDYSIDVPVRSLKYPSLIFFVTIKPADANAPKDVSELPDPNRLTIDDIKSLKGMGAIAALAAMGGIKRTVGPEPIVVAGQPGRILAREYHHEGSLTTSSSGAAYEMQADVVGVQGRPDMPAITIKMAAALPDPDPTPPPTRGSFGQIHHYEPKRPALKGVKTPPFEEGMAYFRQVLASVRTLPALTAVPKPSTPAN